ncbi:MAG TPA: hypothetical protein ENK58_04285 [Desulfobacterales bacterium]|nr:hypothetical protein [Desulfobacterales bacterium]
MRYNQKKYNPSFELVTEFRNRIFEAVLSSDIPGLIFTYVWAFNQDADSVFIESCVEKFTSKGADVYFVELEASLEERLIRNTSKFRLEHKAPKRDTEKSEELLLKHEKEYQFNTDGFFPYKENYVKINNTSISARETAEKICRKINLNKINS